MFSTGDKVVYPLYGAGIIEGLEEKTIDGISQNYYVLRMPIGNLTIMLSVRKCGELGIRYINPGDKIFTIISSVKNVPVEMNDNWNIRNADNMAKIKSGNLSEVALVFRNLRERERTKGLSSAEKKVLTTAKQIILSELILSCDIDKANAEKMLENELEGSLNS